MEIVVSAGVAALVAALVVVAVLRGRGLAPRGSSVASTPAPTSIQTATAAPARPAAAGAATPAQTTAGEGGAPEPEPERAPDSLQPAAIGPRSEPGAEPEPTPAPPSGAAPVATAQGPDGERATPVGDDREAEPGAEGPEGGEATPAGPGGNGAAAADRRAEIEEELRERRAELGRIEERMLGKEKAASSRLAEIERREASLEDRTRNLDAARAELKAGRREQVRELERVAGLSTAQARQILLRELEDELRHDSARLIRQVQEQTKHDAERRARNILATCMQRIAGGHAAETTTSMVTLQSDDLKGRVIGREGRNIRALETLTGIDFIIDDTPSAVILSGFDGVRREIARLTLQRLLDDGRIHPARIEEAYGQACQEIDGRIVEIGDGAVFEANCGSVHPELVKLLGRLHYRTSYGQNVLAHSLECSRLAALVAAELGAGAKTAQRAALLHDIGKAVTHEIEGPHALVGADLARRYGEPEAVVHGIESHHNEVEPQTIEAIIIQVVDSISGARPGARGESLEHYVKRLRELEAVATRHAGVDKVYAMQAGREVRVIVSPETTDDDAAALISHKIARDVERELEYPGQIKVTVIRESRSVDVAR